MSDFYDLYYREPAGLSPEDFEGRDEECAKCNDAWLAYCECD